jgi:hypothetical protein
VSLQFGDLGHARGANKENADRFFNDQAARFFARHLKDGGASGVPRPGSVTSFTQTCPQDAPARGPYQASSWRALHPGRVRFSGDTPQLVTSTGGNPATGRAVDPISGGGDACATVGAEPAPGTAVYVGPPSDGYTMMGLPKVTARIDTTGDWGELNSRLWDVGGGEQRLVSRGAYRLKPDQDGRVTFQLFGNGYRFPRGHRPKLELLGKDEPFLRPSNFPFTVNVLSAQVELPTLARSASGGAGGAGGASASAAGAGGAGDASANGTRPSADDDTERDDDARRDDD